ncbi:hypothetical protein SARC_12764 [Sphaeroforma arctica JP610]|uniref:Uncharacterized protein n=1 Tax=Sphaeroforma arctica JP610 TaxID=667725 RepID=A0A0L0FD48_9EUKA|nr:hypothetical protein SARC_12764 [Sphaeroforma arctica JP610]KNC74694.1 hypothetical protein SARC_12764 [Sphaeroforma arctica JP610]|eukprot:XP_014148596.1 hypothetical protein SARC_12764 [Sphaeroforma arctica JP610]
MGKPGQLTQQPGHVVIDVGFGGDEVEGGDTPIHAQSYTDAMLHRRNGRNQISRAGKPGTNTDFLSTYRPTINRRNTIIAQPHTHTHTHAQSSSQTGANDSNGLKEGVFVRPPRPAYLADYRQRSTRNRTNGWALSVKQKLQAMGQLPAVSSTNGYESDDAINRFV